MTDEEIAVHLAEHRKEIESLKHRVAACEEQMHAIGELTRAVDRLADNMAHMLGEQREQGERLKELESAPLREMQRYKRQLVGCILSALASAAVTAALTLLAQAG